MKRYVLFLFALLALLMGARPATAQIIVAEDPRTGERILMSETLRRAEHKIMVRAVGRIGDERTVWALTFRSTDARSDVQVTADGNAIEAQRIATDEEAPGGMTTLFLSGDAYYDVANASKVEITIGEKALTLPEQIQEDMREILNRSKG